MSVDILQMLVDSACSEGTLSQQDRELLQKKASDLGVSREQLEKMIHGALNPGQKQNIPPKIENQNSDDSSGFVISNETTTKKEEILTNNVKKEEVTTNLNINDSLKSTFSDISTLDNQGAMSVVSKGKLHGKWIIIKRIKPEFKNNEKYKELFYKEFENAYHLDHPNIIRLLDKGEDKDGAFYTMEFVDGQPLSKLITPTGIKDERLVKRIMIQILDALTYVHKKQVFHRDLKPDNILITYRGDNVKILDFGLAAADSFDDDLIKVGTPKYASPEQMTKGYAVDQRSDIYSVGMIFLEMLTGSVNDKSASSVKNPNYQTIVQKCTKQNPAERFDDCQDIMEWLNKPVPVVNEVKQDDLVNKELTELKIKADNAFGNKNYPTARSLYEQYLAKDPNNQDAKNKLQQCLKNMQSTGEKKKFPVIPVVVGLVVVILIVVGFLMKDKIFGTSKNDNKDTATTVVVDNYKVYKEEGDNFLKNLEYENALASYEKAKKEKDTPEINTEITKITDLIAARNKADNYFDKDKNLVKAIEQYKKVLEISANDTHSSNRITECEKIINSTKFADLTSKTEGGKIGFTNSDGYLVVDYLYDEISKDFAFWKGNGIIPLKKDSKWGYYIKSLKNFVNCEYDKEGSFMQGKIKTTKGGTSATIDPDSYSE